MAETTLKDVLKAFRDWWPHRYGIFATEAFMLTVNDYIKSKTVRKTN